MNHHYKIKQATTEITSHLATTTNLIETDEIAQVILDFNSPRPCFY